ncbi:MAG: GHKL domain-containing protein [Ruminococcus sp.]|nr:GHKL domain-containing protein [Ruminococcus sp.]
MSINGIFHVKNELLFVTAVSMFVNISIFLFIKLTTRSFKETLCSYAETISAPVYFVILSVLFINSALISNQAVSIQPQSRSLQAGINRTLLVACMLPVLAMAALLLFNTASEKRFESSAVMLEMQLDMRDFRLRSLEQLNAEIAEFKHDYTNHLLCLHSLVNRSDYENARVYIENITGRCRIGEIVRIFSGNKAADAVISSKFSSVRALGINTEFYGCISKSISPNDISAILFNALDNAAESCRKAAGGISRQAIRLLCILDRGFQIIIVSNPCCACPPFVPDPNRRGRGCGLRIIKKTVGIYGGYVSVKHTNSMFTLTLGFPVGSHTAAAAEKYTKTMY